MAITIFLTAAEQFVQVIPETERETVTLGIDGFSERRRCEIVRRLVK